MLERVKAHVKRHQVAYAFGSGCVLVVTTYFVGGAAVRLIAGRASNVTVFNNVINNSNGVNFGGPMHKIVKCLETGEMWETVTDSAKAASVPLARMSRHLNGHNPHLNGLHYEIIGMGTA